MSRVAKNPITIPDGVEIKFDGQQVIVKGPRGTLYLHIHPTVDVKQEDNVLTFALHDQATNWAMAGTTRALLHNMIVGVSEGFEKKLRLNGVGYRVKVAGNVIHLTVGYSHPIEFTLPEGIQADAISQTEIAVRGADKQQVGQVAANIRAFRPPEPYKGKGIMYADERIQRKEAKKK